ncbi:metallophosphoesterase family protein [Clostridium sp.]|uniref:metallophosphoesterase family protein n=1 Tax=Clostridium sp. TaxID=1506 RepID=UPI00346468C4
MGNNIDSVNKECFGDISDEKFMSYYEMIVARIKRIRDKVEKLQYKNEDELREDIEGISQWIWNGLEDIYTFDLSNVSKIHEFLIDEVINLHNEEDEVRNEKIFSNVLNMKNIKNHGIDGKRGSRIYLFKDSSYEYYFVGDIHSDDFIIRRILENCDFFKKIVLGKNIRLIFLGDYVDRGKEHLKAIGEILILKYIFPGNIYLTKGDHDGGFLEGDDVKLCVGKPLEDKMEDYFILFLDILTKKNGSFSKELIKKYLELFNSMAIINIIIMEDKIILGAHGGLPRPHREEKDIYGYIKSTMDLTDESIIDNIGKTIVQNILWSDPLRGDQELREGSGRFRFKKEEFYEFSRIFGVDIFIRGHEAHENGCEKYFDNGVYSVFSSGSIIENGRNINLSTAYDYVSPKIIKIDLKKGIQVLPIK